jgi:hypothetical protein
MDAWVATLMVWRASAPRHGAACSGCGGVGRGGTPAFGFGRRQEILRQEILRQEILRWGGDWGVGSFDRETAEPQVGLELTDDAAHRRDPEQRQIEGFTGIEPCEDAAGAECGVVAAFFPILLGGENHQREKLQKNDAHHVDRPFDRVGRSIDQSV